MPLYVHLFSLPKSLNAFTSDPSYHHLFQSIIDLIVFDSGLSAQ